MKRYDVTLVGAGLAGSLLAVGLAKRGLRVRMVERRPDLRKVALSAGRSINLALANRGMAALDRVGLLDHVRGALIPMRGRMLHDEQGRLQLLPYGNKPEEVIYSVSRSGLNALLLDAAEAQGVDISFQQSCRGADLGRGVVLLREEQTGAEREEEAPVLIGTDGSASAVREAVLRAAGGEFREEPLAHGYKELCIAAGPGGSFQMERDALHIWPRGEFMLIALPNPDGSFTLTLFLPNQSTGTPGAVAASFAELQDEAAVGAFFRHYFADAVPLLPDLAAQFAQNPLGHLGTVRCGPWHDAGRALVLGDAAHAVVPFHGQGMNCAFEDCIALWEALDAHGPAWDKVFGAVYAARKPNADAIADMALENYVEMRASVRDPRFQAKKELSFRLEDHFGERFAPRYSLVMFHTLPYAEAQRRGVIQDEILEALLGPENDPRAVNLEEAGRLISSRLTIFRPAPGQG